MSFKRKRSDSNSSPASTSSLFSRSSVSPTPLSHFGNAMQLDAPTQTHPAPTPSWAWQPGSDAANASGRTQKRVRDNRPDERLIHESTLRRLYSAQREHPNPSPVPSEEPDPAESTSSELPAQKSTLHTFWGNISKPASKSSTSSMPITSRSAASPRCEDCKASLVSENSMDMDVDMDMDMDGSGPQQQYACNQYACNHCGRMVCGTCSVSRGVRSCLNCAMV